ncbi:hypothetical protein HK105_207438 [Polyrhizophydium stewartii]|uniref:Secreted protein n=1 Tax=Polyrhizophydium stewartii TaxID=2732419 RepID=A0ABR4N0P8_9FUNG
MLARLLIAAAAALAAVAATTSQPAAPAQTNTSNAAPPTSTSTGVPQSQPDIDRANCEAAVKTLINQFGDCVSNFDLAYPSTSAADAAARNFISCICTTTAWVAGSPQILSASVPSCPAPDGISKGDMAAIAAECAPSSTENQRRLVIQSFHLNTTVSRKIYVPLSGLPPGVTSAASAPAAMLAASAPALAIALALAHLIL